MAYVHGPNILTYHWPIFDAFSFWSDNHLAGQFEDYHIMLPILRVLTEVEEAFFRRTSIMFVVRVNYRSMIVVFYAYDSTRP